MSCFFRGFQGLCFSLSFARPSWAEIERLALFPGINKKLHEVLLKSKKEEWWALNFNKFVLF